MIVWWADLRRFSENVGALLDDADYDRLAQLSRPVDRRRTEVGIAAAKVAAAAILGQGIGHLQLHRHCSGCGSSRHGRPYFKRESGLQVSIAHSGWLVMVAVSPNGPVGIDVEVFEAGGDFLIDPAVVGYILTPRERMTPDVFSWEQIARTWVRKEAVLKCTGEGLVRAPSSFELKIIGGGESGFVQAKLGCDLIVDGADLLFPNFTSEPGEVMAAIAWRAPADRDASVPYNIEDRLRHALRGVSSTAD